MGVLDDAIREHIELKRKHGADEAELEQDEQEALGPARREAAASADEEPEAGDAELGPAEDRSPTSVDEVQPVRDEPVEDPAAEVFVDEPTLAMPSGAGADPEAAGSLDPDAPLDPDPPETAVEPRQQGSEPAFGDAADFFDSEPEAAQGQTPPKGFVERQDEPFPEPDARPPDFDAEHDSGEDVLEETPDFLQETPEHDRLWFEQKPPRDFDFDD